MKYGSTTPQSQGLREARSTQSLQSCQFIQHLTKMGTSKNHPPFVTMKIPNHLTCAARNAPGATLEMFKSGLRFAKRWQRHVMVIGHRAN